ncbi:ABC transporter ATP-binding protein [Rhodopseudomonas sp. BR0M22]|uniref:ABC transporter ATP-binding protein n=1 Tax=Rhodopseudomonas sp. BR0M22 TaxID=2269369 RepID=UPI0013DFA140|nr:ABC transporter ATP-binding protein [Rhodopseudomonas sp. BR0M22]NEW90530.1 ABC transporter ATP-binding protein [Rhodopseudomonas sp. BR0M22]
MHDDGSGPSPAVEILRNHVRADWRSLSVVVVVVVISSAASVAAPYLFSRAIDQLPKAGASGELLYTLFTYAALIGIASVLSRVVQYLSVIISENLGYFVSTELFTRILRKRSEFFIEHNPAEIQNAVGQGRGALTTIANIALIVWLPSATQVGLTLFTLGYLLDLQIVLAVAVYGVIVVLATFGSTRRSQQLLDAAMAASQDNAKFAGNAMNAMETLRQLGSSTWMSRRFADRAGAVRDGWRAYMLRRAGTSALLGLGLAVQSAINFALLLPRYQAGLVSVGDIVLFNALLLQLNTPFEMIAQTMDSFARSRAQLGPLTRLWNAPEERDDRSSVPFSMSGGRITFEQVGYDYGNGRGVSGVGFSAVRGAITFIVGETGAGKSTVFKLAVKSIEPQQGRITVDGTDIRQIARADWFKMIAVVPQEVILLNESLADNILLGRERDDVRLRDVAIKAAILNLIESLPDGFDTTVGERGLKLSGGERQRIAIARALYGAPAMLFLDEVSSALDEDTERDIMDHIRAIACDVTVLAITHRRSFLRPMDNVVDLSASRAASRAHTND